MAPLQKFSYGKIFLLGFGFFGISVIWSIYNSYVPVFLKEHALPSWLVGFIMTIDNIFAVVLLPYIGVLSDLTRTRLGRRKPYILAGAPPAALTFALIPLLRGELIPMMIVILLMNLSMALFRSPVIAFMPDVTPSEYRSQANGIINFMGGVGSLLAFFAGSWLYRLNPTYPFIASAVLLAASSFLVIVLVDEPEEFKVKGGKSNIGGELGRLFRRSFADLGGLSPLPTATQTRASCSCWRQSSSGSWATTLLRLSSRVTRSGTWGSVRRQELSSWVSWRSASSSSPSQLASSALSSAAGRR
ncbi:MAG: MFS transporter [Thermofilum sp.]